MVKTLKRLSSKAKILSLNEQQKKAVTTTDTSVLVLAGAGSGKTRVITAKIAYLILEKKVNPAEILAITFTNKAALEMKSRIENIIPFKAQKNNLIIKTFHSWGVFFLRNFIHLLPPYNSNFSIIDEDDKKKIIKNLTGDYKITESEVRNVQKIFSYFKNDLLYGTEENFQQKIRMYYSEKIFSFSLKELYLKYVHYLVKANLLDFDDLIALPLKLKDHEIVNQYIHRRWAYLLVDEYQDTNFCQEKIVEWFKELGSTLTLVGDDHQSIYSFRGANFENIFNFSKKYADIKVVTLEENYRSEQAILNLANNVIEKNKVGYKKTLFSNLAEGKLPLHCQFKFQEMEGKWLADEIAMLQEKKIPLNEIAIFYRTNFQSRNLEESLIKRKIPYKIIGGINFYQRKEIKDILAYLKLLLNPLDSNAFLRVINFPPRNLGIKSVEKILHLKEKQENDFFKTLDNISQLSLTTKATFNLLRFRDFYFQAREKLNHNENFFDFINFVINESGLKEYYEKIKDLAEREQSLGYLEEFTNAMAGQFNNDFNLLDNLKEMIERISLLENFSLEEKQNWVNLLTIHNAKGLEFNYVYIVGLEEGVFPHYLSLQEDYQIEEERRIFYVGVTRAKKQLVLTSSEFKSYQGRLEFYHPSRFVRELSADFLEKKDYTKWSFFS